MIHREEWGFGGEGGDGGAPLLLVHGLGCSTVVWNLAAPLLAEATGRPVVAVDLPGFGQTPLPRGRLTLSGYAGVVNDVAAELGGAVVVGNSMGGAVATLAAAQPGTAVERLVLVSPALATGGGPLSTRARYAFMATPGIGPATVSLIRRRRGPLRSVELRLQALVHRPAEVAESLRRELVEEAERLRHGPAARAYSAATRAIGFEAARVWGRLRSVAAPALVVHGRDDPLVPVSLVDRLRAVRDDWHYEIYEECGHWPQVEHPEHLARSVARWLR